VERPDADPPKPGEIRPGEVRVLVRGIARGVAVTELADLFAPYGADPNRIALPRDRRTRRRKGIAYLVFANARLAAAAIAAFEGTILQEKTLTLELASDRPPKHPRGRGPR
jgi:RNA recognition motif-containing protein